jgi:hypothetical protein
MGARLVANPIFVSERYDMICRRYDGQYSAICYHREYDSDGYSFTVHTEDKEEFNKAISDHIQSAHEKEIPSDDSGSKEDHRDNDRGAGALAAG